MRFFAGGPLAPIASGLFLLGCSAAPAPQPLDQDQAAREALIARMEEEIRRNPERYTRFPRKQFVSSRSESRFTEYVREWSARVESVGNANYPDEARGKLYGRVQVVVTLRPDGSVDSAEIGRSSGHEVLDRAALRIVELASPFAPFPPEIRRDTDLLVIVRTWNFSPGETKGDEAPSSR